VGAGTIYDPTTGAAFLNNTIPANRINPSDRSCSTVSCPNLAGPRRRQYRSRVDYSGVYVQQQDVSRGDARFDHTINSRILFVRYSIFTRHRAAAAFGPQATGVRRAARQGDSRNQSWSSATSTFLRTAINEFRASYARIATRSSDMITAPTPRPPSGFRNITSRRHIERSAAHRDTA